jgi:hypothetical protein
VRRPSFEPGLPDSAIEAAASVNQWLSQPAKQRHLLTHRLAQLALAEHTVAHASLSDSIS